MPGERLPLHGCLHLRSQSHLDRPPRIATWLLVTDPSFVARVRDPFAARSRIYKLPVALVCDALKIAYATQGREQFKEVFFMVRNLRKLLNLQIRLGDRAGSRRVRPVLSGLKAYWEK